MNKIHLIACGGAVMHNMMIALHLKGYHITGSDDAIYDPALSRLKKHGLLPKQMGWDENNITEDLDAVILGMHARIDNPELHKAQELGLKIYSFPEFIFENSRDKKRVVIGGSHGKTTTTAMIMHVMKSLGKDFDYMVGSIVQGFETMVKLTQDSPVIILEGDEYLSSPIDMRPKFHLYHPQIAMLTGIAWDHVNVFPTFENYMEQFDIFVRDLEPGALLFYFKEDKNLQNIIARYPHVNAQPYTTPEYYIDNENISHIQSDGKDYPLQIFGEHNLQNMEGARMICETLGISRDDFYTAMRDFAGAARRLELLYSSDKLIVYRDFAHSPSKLKSTVEAVSRQYHDARVIAVFELHTFSSLDASFLPEYAHCMDEADLALVYFDEETLKQKRKNLNEADVRSAFGNNVDVYSKPGSLHEKIKTLLMEADEKTILLLMSSGNFGGIKWLVTGDQ
jgi:UDP-N-acetylmuramate: L-alanyl-gamma-D-glutamyl-meso-diaminopimelate ligase